MEGTFSDGKLPSSFYHEVQSSLNDVIMIRSNLKELKDCNLWVREFGELNNTKWNTRTSRPEGEKFVCLKKFICQHSAHLKVSPEANKRSFSKNTGCLASISIKIKLNSSNTRKKDPFIKRGLCAVIALYDVHNHSLTYSSPINLFSADYKEQFFGYFNEGMGVSEARRHHRELMEKDGRYSEDDMADKTINPPYRSVQYWRDLWRLQNVNPKEQLSKLRFPRKSNDLVEIEKTSKVSIDQISNHEGNKDSTDENKESESNSSTEEQVENEPKNLTTESLDPLLKKKKPLHPQTSFGRPKGKGKKKKKSKPYDNIFDYYKDKASKNLINRNSEKQTETSDNLTLRDSHAIIPATATIKIEKDTFITPDYIPNQEKEDQSIDSASSCSIEIKKEKLTDSSLNYPAVREEEILTIPPDDTVATKNKPLNPLPSNEQVVNKNDEQIINTSNDPIASESEKSGSNDNASSNRENQDVRATENENQITTPSNNVFESQTKEQTVPASSYFQPIIETTTSLQSTQIPQTSDEKQKVNIFFLQVPASSPFLKPGVEVKDLAILPGGIPPLITPSTNSMSSTAQNLSNAPKLSGSLIANGTNSNPILILRSLETGSTLPAVTTCSTSAKTYSSKPKKSNQSRPKNSKKKSTLPATESELPKSSMQRLYIKEEPIDIIDEEMYELSDASMRNSFIPSGQLEHFPKDQPLSPTKRDLGEEINRCYSYAEKLYKRLKSERLSIEDSSSISASSTPKNSSKGSEKRKADSGESDSNRKQTEDEIDDYCKLVAKRLKNFDSETCAFVQKSIDNLLCDAEIGLGGLLHKNKDGDRSVRECATPTYLSMSDEPTSPFSLGGSSTSGDSESTLTAVSDSNS